MTVFFICDAHVHERQNLSVCTKLVQMAHPVWPKPRDYQQRWCALTNATLLRMLSSKLMVAVQQATNEAGPCCCKMASPLSLHLLCPNPPPVERCHHGGKFCSQRFLVITQSAFSFPLFLCCFPRSFLFFGIHTNGFCVHMCEVVASNLSTRILIQVHCKQQRLFLFRAPLTCTRMVHKRLLVPSRIFKQASKGIGCRPGGTPTHALERQTQALRELACTQHALKTMLHAHPFRLCTVPIQSNPAEPQARSMPRCVPKHGDKLIDDRRRQKRRPALGDPRRD